MNANKNLVKMNLQMFGDQYAFDMNPNTTTTLSKEMKTFYDKALLRSAEPELVYDRYAQKRPIPKNGGKTINFRKFASLPKATTALTEGVTPNGQSLTVTDMTATIAQYGDYVTLTDVLDMTAIDNVVVEATQLIGSQAGRTLDTITREVVVGGSNIMYAPKIGAGGAETPVTTRSGLDATCVFKPKYVYRAERILKRNNAPKIDGKYIAIVHPDVSADIMQDDLFIDVTKYASPKGAFPGEIGTIGNTRFVESTEAKIWQDATCPSDGASGHLAVYGIVFVGKNAYGTTDVDGLGLQTIIKNLGSGGTADPLNQRSTVGWKCTKVAKRLVEEYMVRFECVSGISANDNMAN